MHPEEEEQQRCAEIKVGDIVRNVYGQTGRVSAVHRTRLL